MAIENDISATHAYAVREENPALLAWERNLTFAVAMCGMTELTKENLGQFMVRQAVLNAACGSSGTLGFDPTIPECFVGLKVWGRHHPGKETDAQFFRRMAKTAAYTATDLSRAWSERKPGDVLGNLSFADKILGKCPTCPSHHDQSMTHDGEN